MTVTLFRYLMLCSMSLAPDGDTSFYFIRIGIHSILSHIIQWLMSFELHFHDDNHLHFYQWSLIWLLSLSWFRVHAKLSWVELSKLELQHRKFCLRKLNSENTICFLCDLVTVNCMWLLISVIYLNEMKWY